MFIRQEDLNKTVPEDIKSIWVQFGEFKRLFDSKEVDSEAKKKKEQEIITMLSNTTKLTPIINSWIDVNFAYSRTKEQYVSLLRAFIDFKLIPIELINVILNIPEIDVNQPDTKYYLSPIGRAAANNRLEVVLALAAKGANLHQKTKLGLTPYMEAVKRGHLGIATFLIDQGADITAQNIEGINAMDMLMDNTALGDKRFVVAEELLKYISFKGLKNPTIKDEYLEFVHRYICKLKIIKNDLCPVVFSPDSPQIFQELFNAILENNFEKVMECLNKKECRDNINSLIYSYRAHTTATILHMTITDISPSIMRALLKVGVNVEIGDDQYGNTPLLGAAGIALGHYNFPAVKILIEEQKVDINQKNNNGRTALHCAVGHGCLDIAKYLLDHGADLLLTDNSNHNALDYLCIQSALGYKEKRHIITEIVNYAIAKTTPKVGGQSPLKEKLEPYLQRFAQHVDSASSIAAVCKEEVRSIHARSLVGFYDARRRTIEVHDLAKVSKITYYNEDEDVNGYERKGMTSKTS